MKNVFKKYSKNIITLKSWIICYAIGLVLVPPIKIGSKAVFAAEWMLLPLIICFGVKVCKKSTERPPKQLILLIIGLGTAFIAGIFRADLVQKITYYVLDGGQFSISQDGTRFFRWAVLFSLPYLLVAVEPQRLKRRHLALTFFIAFKICLSVSAIFAILEAFKFINISQFYHTKTKWSTMWLHRSYATFQTPLEAGLVFGAAIIIQASLLFFKKIKFYPREVIMILLWGAVLFLTHTATAWIALAVSFLPLIYQAKLVRDHKFKIALILVGLGLILMFFISPVFLQNKLEDFGIRARAWINWVHILPEYPYILFVGLGFSPLVTDNSFIFLIFTGGLLLLFLFLNWFSVLLKKMPKEYLPFVVFWLVSWLAIDSIGYWGVGRLGWLLLGLF